MTSKLLLFFYVIFIFGTISAFSCRIRDEKGNLYDLSKISTTALEGKAKTGDDRFKFNFCNKVEEAACKAENGNFCSYFKDGKFKKVLAVYDGKYTAKHEEDGVTLTYSNVDDASRDKSDDHKKIVANFRLTCDIENKSDKVEPIEYTFWGNTFLVTISSPAACVTSSGLSGGWIFIIILSVILFLWLVVGTLVNIFMFKAAKNTSAIFGLGFITALFKNALVGIKFVYSKIVNRKSLKHSGGDYSTFE